MTNPKRIATIAFTPAPGYNPVRDILAQPPRKTHTLRTRRVRVGGLREVKAAGERTGIILRFTHSEEMTRAEFGTDEFARADGLADWAALEALLIGFYERVPEIMHCCHFTVAERGEH